MHKNHFHGDQFHSTLDLCCFISVTALKDNFSLDSGPCCLWRKAAEGSPALPTEHEPDFFYEREAAGQKAEDGRMEKPPCWGCKE